MGFSKKFIQYFRPIFHGVSLRCGSKHEIIQDNRNTSRCPHTNLIIAYFTNTDYFNKVVFLLCFQMDTSDKNRYKTFTQIHCQQYYTDLISFHKIFFSDLAFHLMAFNSLNNILIILLNFAADRKSELIRTSFSARSCVQFMIRFSSGQLRYWYSLAIHKLNNSKSLQKFSLARKRFQPQNVCLSGLLSWCNFEMCSQSSYSSFGDCNRFLGINSDVPGSGCRVIDTFDRVPGGV